MQENGLAISTTIVYLFLLVLSISIISIKFDIIDIKHFLLKLLFFLVNALMAYLLTRILLSFNNKNDIYLVLSMLISFVFIYLLNSLITKNRELELITSSIKNLFNIKKV